MNKTEFDNLSAILCARMVSPDSDTRRAAAKDADELLDTMPKALRNSPHCFSEIDAMNALIASVCLERN